MTESNSNVDAVNDDLKSQKKVIKKRATRRKKGSTTRLYFNADTQAAIVAYQTAETSEERNRLYNTEIRPAFEKLTENLINIHKFTSAMDSYDDLKNDCVTFLFETIYKFDPTRGSNAFSYYNVCLTGDTHIPLFDGTTITMSELASRDVTNIPTYVYSVDPSIHRINPGRVTHAWKTKEVDTLSRVHTNNGGIIECTCDHLFMLHNGTYVRADELASDQLLMSSHTPETINCNIKIVKTEVIKLNTPIAVYDIEVENWHNFVIATHKSYDNALGYVIVHNCAKNFLIIRTKQKAQRLRRSVSIDDTDAMTLSDKRTIADAHIVPSQETVLEGKMTVHNIISVLYEIRTAAKSENELACINSIITVFENIHDIDLLNRSAVMLYIRELSGLSPKQLTTAMQLIKRQYRRLKLENRLPF